MARGIHIPITTDYAQVVREAAAGSARLDDAGKGVLRTVGGVERALREGAAAARSFGAAGQAQAAGLTAAAAVVEKVTGATGRFTASSAGAAAAEKMVGDASRAAAAGLKVKEEALAAVARAQAEARRQAEQEERQARQLEKAHRDYVATLERKNDQLRRQAAAAKISQAELQKEIKLQEVENRLEKERIQTGSKLASQVDKLTREEMELRQELEKLTRTQKETTSAQEQSIVTLGRLKGVIGGIAGLAGGIAVGAQIKQSMGEAAEFGRGVGEVSTLIEGTAEQVAYLNSTSKELSMTYGQMPEGEVKAFYQSLSAGAGSAENATKLLHTANKLAIGGVTDVKTGVDGLTSSLNAYRMGMGRAGEVSDAMFVAMRAGKTTIAELSSNIGNVAPLAAQTGTALDELLAATAALTLGGQSTSTAMTGLRAILAAVAKPSAEATELAKELGIEFNATGLRAKGFAGFLDDVREKTGGSTEKLAVLFGGVEALVPMLALAGSAGKSFGNILDQMKEKAGATEAAFAKMSRTDALMADRLKATGKVIGIEFGEGILSGMRPALSEAAGELDTAELRQQAKETGEVIGKALGAAASAAALLVKHADEVKAAMVGLGAGTAALGLARFTSSVGFANAALGVFIGLAGRAGAAAALASLVAPAGWAALAIGGVSTALYVGYQRHKDAEESTRRYEQAVRELNKVLPNSASLMRDGAAAALEQSEANYKAVLSFLELKEAQLDSVLSDPETDGSERSAAAAELAAAQERIRGLDLWRAKMMQAAKDQKLWQQAESEWQAEIERLRTGGSSSSTGTETDAAKKLREQIEKLIETAKREARQAQERAKISTDLAKSEAAREAGLRELAKRHEIENAVVSAGIKISEDQMRVLVAGGLTTDKYANALADYIRKRLDANDAEEAAARISEELRKRTETAGQAIQGAGEAVDKLREGLRQIELPRDMFDESAADGWAEALTAASAEIFQLEQALELLEPGSAAYKAALQQLREFQELHNKALADTPRLLGQVADAQDRASLVAEKAARRNVAMMKEDAAALLSGRRALDELRRSRELDSAALEARESLVRRATETEGAFAARQALVGLEARKALASLQAAELVYENYVRPMEQAADDVARSLADAIVSPLRTGKFEWEQFGQDLQGIMANSASRMVENWLRQWTDAMAAWFAKFVAMQLKAAAVQRATTAASTSGTMNYGGGGAGGGWGGIATNAATKYMTGGGTTAATSGGSAMAGYAALGGWVAAFAAVYLVLKNQLKTAGTVAAEVSMNLSAGQWAVNNVKGSAKRLEEAQNTAMGIAKSLNEFIKSLGGEALSGSEVTLGRTGQGKKTDHWVKYGAGLVENFGRDAQAAMEFGMIQAAKNADYKGLDPIVEAAIRNTAQKDWEEFQEDVDTARNVAMMAKPQSAREQIALHQSVDTLLEEIARILKGTDALGEGIRNATTDYALNLRAQRDALTGRKRTAAEERELQMQQIRAWNAELDVRKANVALKIVEVRAQIEQYKATHRLIGGGGGAGAAGGGIYGVNKAAITTAGSLGVLAAAITGSGDAALLAMEAQLAALEELARTLNDVQKIQDGEVKFGRGGDGRGASSGRDTLQGMLADHEREKARRGMSDYQKLLDDIGRKWDDATKGLDRHGSSLDRAKKRRDDAIKAANGNADAIKKANEEYERSSRNIRRNREEIEKANKAREEELQWAREQRGKELREEIAPWTRDFGKTDFQQSLEAERKKIEEQRAISRADRFKMGGPKDWELDAADANITAKFRGELDGMINSFRGLSGGAVEVQREADALRQNVLALGLSADETAKRLAGIDLGEAFRKQQGGLDPLGKLAGYLKNSAQHAAMIDRIERERITLDLIVLEEQLKAWNRWNSETESAVGWVRSNLPLVMGTAAAANDRTYQRAERAARMQQESASTFADSVKQWTDAQNELLGRWEKSLLDNSTSFLSPEQQLAEAERQFRATEAKARGGDIEALRSLDEAGRAWIREREEFEGRGGGWADVSRTVDGIIRDLAAAPFRQGNVVAPSAYWNTAGSDFVLRSVTQRAAGSAAVPPAPPTPPAALPPLDPMDRPGAREQKTANEQMTKQLEAVAGGVDTLSGDLRKLAGRVLQHFATGEQQVGDVVGNTGATKDSVTRLANALERLLVYLEKAA